MLGTPNYVRKLRPTGKRLIKELIRQCDGYANYVDSFSLSPDRLNPSLWGDLVERCQEKAEDPLSAIEKAFGVTTLPAFSDILGDQQAYWTDVTYLRFDLADEPQGKTPFLTQAGINVEHPTLPNQKLFDVISEITPHYCRKFGIDGARIDMGHALPQQIQEMILTKTKRINPNFSFWSEDFDHRKGQRAHDRGEAFITGALWKIYRKVSAQDFSERLPGFLNDSAVPILGALETPDSFRATWLYPDLATLKFVLFLNAFAPNVIPFVNNGMEFGETQPMNFGIDIPTGDEEFLPKNHPLRGKLPLFDHYTFRWSECGKSPLVPFLQELLRCRRAVCHAFTREAVWPKAPNASSNLLVFQYISQSEREVLTFVANRGDHGDLIISLDDLLPTPAGDTQPHRIAHVGAASITDDRKTIKLGPLSGLLLQSYGGTPT